MSAYPLLLCPIYYNNSPAGKVSIVSEKFKFDSGIALRIRSGQKL
jgi:hypothetical protein